MVSDDFKLIKNTKHRSTITIDQLSKLSSLGPTQTSGWIQGQHLPAQSSDIDELELAAPRLQSDQPHLFQRGASEMS